MTKKTGSVDSLNLIQQEMGDAHEELARSDAGPISTTDLAEGLKQISRATDALVSRVTGARDPSEHLLDQSRRAEREETPDGRQINIRCDRCGLKSPGAATVDAASDLAMAQGWFVSEDADHCPVCKDGARLLPGQVAGEEAMPREISILDQIFMTRIEWLRDRYKSGATGTATLLNARRSGHRSMLTDLAKELRYDAVLFNEKVRTLIGHGDLRDPFWLSVVEGGEDPVWLFVGKLFRLLQIEDGQ